MWVPESTAELLATDALPEFLAEHFAGDTGSVQLLRIPGPAGPLFEVGSGGTHRTHLSRTLNLPWMFAQTTLVPVPRRIEAARIIDTTLGPAGCEAQRALWRGLLDRKVIDGELIATGVSTALQLVHAPAPWVVLTAEVASSYCQRYERLYPGSLAQSGIPTASYESAETWRTWLAG